MILFPVSPVAREFINELVVSQVCVRNLCVVPRGPNVQIPVARLFVNVFVRVVQWSLRRKSLFSVPRM